MLRQRQRFARGRPEDVFVFGGMVPQHGGLDGVDCPVEISAMESYAGIDDVFSPDESSKHLACRIRIGGFPQRLAFQRYDRIGGENQNSGRRCSLRFGCG